MKTYMTAALLLAAAATASGAETVDHTADRLDLIDRDGKITSVFADSVDNITFQWVMNKFTRFRLALKDGPRTSYQFSQIPEVRFTPADHTTPYRVTYKPDYNIELFGDEEHTFNEEVEFQSTHLHVPSAVHIFGDYTGKDYAADPDFIRTEGITTCTGRCPDSFSFPMPFEPVTVRIREWQRTLYNGISMPEIWPPVDMDHSSFDPMPVPYLDNIPDVIDISIGRQLFVDDFLIESTDLTRQFHKPVKYAGNPILKAEPSDMTTKIPGATAKDGGVWWEPREGKYRMWYEAGWYGKMALSESTDGLNWSRPDIAGGSNIIPSLANIKCNSSSVVLDYQAPDNERYKLFMRSPNANAPDFRGWAFVSPDGVNWTDKTPTGLCGDKSTMFYNPFRQRWVYSIRSVYLENEPHGRARYYREHPDFLAGADWEDEDVVFWCQADIKDPRDPEFNRLPQLYNLNAVAYESLMISMHQLLMDENTIAQAAGRPKTTELKIGFSRDGFHWHRPYRETFIAASRTEGTWDRGYVQSVGGVFGIVGDELRFYYIGFAGGTESVLHSNGATGVATMRRDGFASMEADSSGSLTTRKLTSDAPNHLFVNTNTIGGSIVAELLDSEGNPIEGFTADKCIPLTADSTISELRWRDSTGRELTAADALKADEPFKIRFNLTSGQLYAFWLSPSEAGESRGYLGASGPGHATNIDTEGKNAY